MGVIALKILSQKLLAVAVGCGVNSTVSGVAVGVVLVDCWLLLGRGVAVGVFVGLWLQLQSPDHGQLGFLQ
jgi:hypothetical protein